MQDETGVAHLCFMTVRALFICIHCSRVNLSMVCFVCERDRKRNDRTRKKHRNRIYDNTSLAKLSSENDWKTVSERKRQNLKRNGVNQKYVIKQSVKSLYSGTVRPLLFFSRSYLYILRIGEGTRERGRKIREKSKVKQNQHCQIFSLWSINEDGNQRKAGRKSWDHNNEMIKKEVEPQQCKYVIHMLDLRREKKDKANDNATAVMLYTT